MRWLNGSRPLEGWAKTSRPIILTASLDILVVGSSSVNRLTSAEHDAWSFRSSIRAVNAPGQPPRPRYPTTSIRKDAENHRRSLSLPHRSRKPPVPDSLRSWSCRCHLPCARPRPSSLPTRQPSPIDAAPLQRLRCATCWRTDAPSIAGHNRYTIRNSRNRKTRWIHAPLGTRSRASPVAAATCGSVHRRRSRRRPIGGHTGAQRG